MAEAVLGSAYTFQALFVDAGNVPIAVNVPLINVFMFSGTGVKQMLVTAQALAPALPAETGRYIYVYTIPTSLTDGDNIYAEMTGTDPGSGDFLRHMDEVVVISSNRGLGAAGGMHAEFVDGG